MSLTHDAVSVTGASPGNGVAASKESPAKSTASASSAAGSPEVRYAAQIAKMEGKGWVCARDVACKDKGQHVLHFLNYCCDKKH